MTIATRRLDIDAASRSIQGSRKSQDDFCRATPMPSGMLAVLCDGMGGYRGGAVASRVVTDFVTARICTSDPPSSAAQQREILGRALLDANNQIAVLKSHEEELSAMGTTLLAVWVDGDSVLWLSVGDSPLWLLRGGLLRRLNEDHSLRGDPERRSGGANLLRSSVSGNDIALVDAPTEALRLFPGDVLVAASDGILTLAEAAIAEIVERTIAIGVEPVAEALIASVIGEEQTRQDNCSVIVLFFKRTPAVAVASGAVEEFPVLADETRPSMRRLAVLALVSVGLAVALATAIRWFLAPSPGGP